MVHMGANGLLVNPGNVIIMRMIDIQNNPMMITNSDIYMYLEKCFTVRIRMDGLVPILEAMKTGDKYRDFCIDDAVFYIKKASEALTDGLKDPEAWFKTSETAMAVFVKSLPLILAIQMLESQGS